MSTTAHQFLLQLVAPRLQALPSVPAANVYTERASAVTRDECPVLNLLPGDNVFESIGSDDGVYDVLKATMPFSIKVHTRGDPHTALADPVIADTHAAVMADPTLGGYALRLRIVRSRSQLAQADATAGIWELSYEATVVISERDLQLRPVV